MNNPKSCLLKHNLVKCILVKYILVWLDVSMKRFEYIHPAGGNEFVSVRLTPEELEKASDAVGWCDVCKGWED